MKVDRQGGLAPGDVLDQNRADLVFDEAHALEDSLTAAWTERVDAIELEIVVNVLSRRSRLLRDIRSKAGGRPAATDAIKAVAAAASQIPPAADALAQAIDTYLHEYGGKSDSAVLQSGVVNSRPEFRLLRQTTASVRYALIQLAKTVNALRSSLDEVRGLNSARQRLRGYSERISNAIDLLDTVGTLPDSHLWVYRLSAHEDDAAAWCFERLPIHVFPEFQQVSSIAHIRRCCARRR